MTRAEHVVGVRVIRWLRSDVTMSRWQWLLTWALLGFWGLHGVATLLGWLLH